MSTVANSTSRRPSALTRPNVAADNTRTLPIMIHRALFGSVERFMAICSSTYAGKHADLALSRTGPGPGVRDDHDAYAIYVARDPRARRSARGRRKGRMNRWARAIRKAKLEKIPYILVVGDTTVEKATLV